MTETSPTIEDGVWAAIYSDRSGCYIFATEIEALRCAVGKSMTVVVFVPWGMDPWEVRP